MRVCLVYDCLFPWTVGGAERWTRNVAEALVAAGHDVTYLTRVQWEPGAEPDLPGIRVVAVSPAEDLYGEDGARTIGQALRFGRGVHRHLRRHGDDYDVVHVSVSPFFGLLGAGLARRGRRYEIAADWHEVWTDDYWREYLGPLRGRVAAAIQRRCARIRQTAFCFSRMHAERLRAIGLRGEPVVLRGEWAGGLERPQVRPSSGRVVFAGRMIPEKHAPLAAEAVLAARARIPDLTATLFGDGPEFERVRALAGDVIRAPGFVDETEVQETLASALCLLLPSTREGYGMVVVEACSLGVPVVLVDAPDNAAIEHIEPGVNGFVAPALTVEALAAALVDVHERGPALRESTADWFAANADELSVARSMERVLAAYPSAPA